MLSGISIWFSWVYDYDAGGICASCGRSRAEWWWEYSALCGGVERILGMTSSRSTTANQTNGFKAAIQGRRKPYSILMEPLERHGTRTDSWRGREKAGDEKARLRSTAATWRRRGRISSRPMESDLRVRCFILSPHASGHGVEDVGLEMLSDSGWGVSSGGAGPKQLARAYLATKAGRK